MNARCFSLLSSLDSCAWQMFFKGGGCTGQMCQPEVPWCSASNKVLHEIKAFTEQLNADSFKNFAVYSLVLGQYCKPPVNTYRLPKEAIKRSHSNQFVTLFKKCQPVVNGIRDFNQNRFAARIFS